MKEIFSLGAECFNAAEDITFVFLKSLGKQKGLKVVYVENYDFNIEKLVYFSMKPNTHWSIAFTKLQ